MKDELQSKLVEILTAMQTVAGQAKDFTLSQLPDIAQSYVVYGRVSNTTLTLALLALSLCCLWAIAVVLRRDSAKRKRFDAGEKFDGIDYRFQIDSFNLYFPSGLFAVVFFGLFAVTLKGTLLVWLAPKVWLLKEIAGLIK